MPPPSLIYLNQSLYIFFSFVVSPEIHKSSWPMFLCYSYYSGNQYILPREPFSCVETPLHLHRSTHGSQHGVFTAYYWSLYKCQGKVKIWHHKSQELPPYNVAKSWFVNFFQCLSHSCAPTCSICAKHSCCSEEKSFFQNQNQSGCA